MVSYDEKFALRWMFPVFHVWPVCAWPVFQRNTAMETLNNISMTWCSRILKKPSLQVSEPFVLANCWKLPFGLPAFAIEVLYGVHVQFGTTLTLAAGLNVNVDCTITGFPRKFTVWWIIFCPLFSAVLISIWSDIFDDFVETFISCFFI